MTSSTEQIKLVYLTDRRREIRTTDFELEIVARRRFTAQLSLSLRC
jgi:hypothetical protein